MYYQLQYSNCKNCFCEIDQRVMEYSLERFNFALCIACQHLLNSKIEDGTKETIDLYFSLRKKNIEAILEKFDGCKTIDIAVADAKVNIEIDGRHHKPNPQQLFKYLKGTFCSFEKGFLTLCIPNALVRENLDEIADYIKAFLAISRQRNAHQKKSR